MRVFLSSLESNRLKEVRECTFSRFVQFDTGKVAVLARIDPPVIGQDFGVPDDLDEVLITTRHAGATLDPISEFPCFVHVGWLRSSADDGRITKDDVEILGWGELYRTAEAAAAHTL